MSYFARWGVCGFAPQSVRFDLLVEVLPVAMFDSCVGSFRHSNKKFETLSKGSPDVHLEIGLSLITLIRGFRMNKVSSK